MTSKATSIAGCQIEARRPTQEKPFRAIAFSAHFKPGINQDKLGQLSDDLETKTCLARSSENESG